ncbi:unnamed protein product [Dibothriocephalus latus]|uniref:VWFA domain-containing protein n=1 Tax=Dibothriocephalus latus TaxID=60516 RepID=A0A3P7LU88_DIBLA|nr:unnamed protein product [Dibothriocephalus latus]
MFTSIHLQDSRNVFGVTPGDRIGLLVEVSDRFLKSGRHSHLRACLREYVDDQWGALSARWSHSAQGAKEAIYVATYGTEVVTLWDEPVAPSWRSLTEAKQFFNCQLKPSGGSNLLAGLKHMLRIGREKHLSTVMVVVGSPPDQDADVIFEFLEQSLAVTTTEEDLCFHFVCFDCNSSGMQQLLARLAAVNQHSSLHCYSPVKDGTAFISDDIALLIKELEAARGLLERVKTKRVQLEAEEAAKKEIIGLDNAANEWDELERPLNLSDGDLNPKRTFLPETSKAWLGRHGLNAKNLGLFQVNLFLVTSSFFLCFSFLFPIVTYSSVFSSSFSSSVFSFYSVILLLLLSLPLL